MHGLRLMALRRSYRIAYRVLWILGRLRTRRARRVKCILTHGEQVLLVQHTYGPRGVWQLPGGGAHRGEAPTVTAAREMYEELGLEELDWRELGRADLLLEHMSVGLTCLQAEPRDPTVRPDPVEIEHARWFARDDLPASLTSEDRRLLGFLESPEI